MGAHIAEVVVQALTKKAEVDVVIDEMQQLIEPLAEALAISSLPTSRPEFSTRYFRTSNTLG